MCIMCPLPCFFIIFFCFCVSVHFCSQLQTDTPTLYMLESRSQLMHLIDCGIMRIVPFLWFPVVFLFLKHLYSYYVYVSESQSLKIVIDWFRESCASTLVLFSFFIEKTCYKGWHWAWVLNIVNMGIRKISSKCQELKWRQNAESG